MNQYTIKFYDFIALYNMMLLNLVKKNRNFAISFYYLDGEFNISIEDVESEEKIFNYHFPCETQEYYYLTTLLGYEFIEGHAITLSLFTEIDRKDAEIYYQKKESSKKPLDYDRAQIHILRNSVFELKLYYFDGLNDISYEMQDRALEKLNLTNKVYKKINKL